ncbi:hypothetical protein [Chryseobacterium sp. IT-36CA2]|uniref:hypothetical protein n=1 Tax=Chryseobacterium sp. IT-36CA2 TaxID=3026460 RepID=UPI0039DF944D
MDTKKNVLEKMSSQELEKYIKPNSKFVPQAVHYAYEILQSRGRKFTDEESAQITSRTVDLGKKQEIIIHPNHTKASHIMYLCGALGIAGFIWSYDPFNSGLSIFVGTATLAFIFGMGYLIGKGNEVVKYILIITFALGLFGLPSILTNLFINPVLGIISIIQTILQIWVIILLVRIPKNSQS